MIIPMNDRNRSRKLPVPSAHVDGKNSSLRITTATQIQITFAAAIRTPVSIRPTVYSGHCSTPEPYQSLSVGPFSFRMLKEEAIVAAATASRAMYVPSQIRRRDRAATIAKNQSARSLDRSISGSRPTWQSGCAIGGSVKAALDLREPAYG